MWKDCALGAPGSTGSSASLLLPLASCILPSVPCLWFRHVQERPFMGCPTDSDALLGALLLRAAVSTSSWHCVVLLLPPLHRAAGWRHNAGCTVTQLPPLSTYRTYLSIKTQSKKVNIALVSSYCSNSGVFLAIVTSCSHGGRASTVPR